MPIARKGAKRCSLPWVWILPTLLALAAPAQSQVTPAAGTAQPDDTPAIRLGVVIFYDYSYQKEPRVADAAGNLISPSAFNVTRTYLNVTGNVSRVIHFRITPDIVRETGEGSSISGSMTFRLKYGYVQLNLDDWLWPGSFVRVGMHQTPFIEYEETTYRYRFQGSVQAERDGNMSSSDVGVSFRALFPRDYGEVYAGLYNGEGYQLDDPNDQKAFMIRGTLRPLPSGGTVAKNIRVTAFYFDDHYVADAQRRRFIFNTMFEHQYFNVGFNWMTRTDQPLPTDPKIDSDGYSFWATPFFKEKGNGPEALFRLDSFRPDSVQDGRQTRLIVGGAWWFRHQSSNATAAILVDMEQLTFKDFPAPAPPKEQRFIVHGLISF